jgi:hypothetical protein
VFNHLACIKVDQPGQCQHNLNEGQVSSLKKSCANSYLMSSALKIKIHKTQVMYLDLCRALNITLMPYNDNCSNLCEDLV